MKAVTYQGIKKIEVKDVEDPRLENKDDIVVRVTTTAISGSDLHLIHGMVPNLPQGCIIGHEPMGVVEEVGPSISRLKKGDRVIIPFNVSCGECYYCKHEQTSLCDNSNPNGKTGGFFGYGDSFGGYPGGQAEFMRVPYGNYTPFKIPDSCEIEDEKLVLLSDVIPTAYWSVDNAGVRKGDTVIILGCGPIGLTAQKFAWLKGASRVIAVDYIDYRLKHGEKTNKVEAYNINDHPQIGEYLKEITHGGADVVIDCVGMDGKMTPMEFLASSVKLHGGSLGGLIEATKAVRKGGTIHITGTYGGRYGGFPLGDLFDRGISIKGGQTPVIPYMPHLYKILEKNTFDPSDIITHKLPLDKAQHGYDIFDTKTEGCIKVVLKPWIN